MLPLSWRIVHFLKRGEKSAFSFSFLFVVAVVFSIFFFFFTSSYYFFFVLFCFVCLFHETPNHVLIRAEVY